MGIVRQLAAVGKARRLRGQQHKTALLCALDQQSEVSTYKLDILPTLFMSQAYLVYHESSRERISTAPAQPRRQRGTLYTLETLPISPNTQLGPCFASCTSETSFSTAFLINDGCPRRDPHYATLRHIRDRRQRNELLGRGVPGGVYDAGR